jgi:hypothetical protein
MSQTKKSKPVKKLTSQEMKGFKGGKGGGKPRTGKAVKDRVAAFMK